MWDIILKQKRKFRLLSSLRFQISLVFLLLLAAEMILLQIYPTRIVRQQMIDSARKEMVNRANTLSAALSGFATLDWSSVNTAVSVLDITESCRVVVADGSGVVVYDSVRSTSLLGRVAMFPEIISALSGMDAFRCVYSPDAFYSHAASPVIRNGDVSAVVYLLQNNPGNASMLAQIRGNIINISVVSALICGVLVVIVSITFSERISTLLRGVRAVGQGDYDYHIDIRGEDELSEVAGEIELLCTQLKETETARRRFISDASHELKTPLAAVKLLSDSILQNENISHADLREFVGDIAEEITRLNNITESLLSLSRLDAQPEPQMQCCDLSDTIRRCVNLLQPTAAQFDVRLVSPQPGEQLVCASREGVYHIFFNLIENAVKYNRPGGSVTISFYREETVLACAVSDTGVGIPEEEQARIFERFYRVEKARSRATGGTGLGLAIVEEWVQLLGRSITVSSRPGVGTCFTVRLKNWQGEVDEHL